MPEPTLAPRRVSILVLTHNASRYVHTTLTSLARTAEVDYEVIVVDNASRFPTRLLLRWLARRGRIDKLTLLDYNSLYAEGNNIAARMADPASTHLLLLNSDIEVRRDDWLAVLLNAHERGITSYGVVMKPIPRADGYCLLIDKNLYWEHGGLDESHQWWWGVTKLQARVLEGGFSVKGYARHDQYLVHFGGKSGKSWKGATGMQVAREEVASWFGTNAVSIIEDVPAA